MSWLRRISQQVQANQGRQTIRMHPNFLSSYSEFQYLSNFWVSWALSIFPRSPFIESLVQPNTESATPTDDVKVEHTKRKSWFDLWYYFNSIWSNLPGLVVSFIGYRLTAVKTAGLFQLYVRCLTMFVLLSSLPAIVSISGQFQTFQQKPDEVFTFLRLCLSNIQSWNAVWSYCCTFTASDSPVNAHSSHISTPKGQ